MSRALLRIELGHVARIQSRGVHLNRIVSSRLDSRAKGRAWLCGLFLFGIALGRVSEGQGGEGGFHDVGLGSTASIEKFSHSIDRGG